MKGTFHGTTVYLSQSLGGWRRVQRRFPRSKRARIRKKWAKNERNWTKVQDPIMCQIGGSMLLCNEAAYAKILAMVDFMPATLEGA